MTTKRDIISDVQTYVAKSREEQASRLDEAKQSEIEPLTINGMKAWQFETKGKLKTAFGQRYTYVTTVIDGEKEVVKVNAWTFTSDYESTGKEDLKQIALSVTGISAGPSPTDSASSSPSPVPAAASPFDQLDMTAPAIATKPTASPSPTAAAVPATPTPTANRSPQTSGNPADRLRDLNKLYQEGVITQEEFDSKKKDILKSM